MTRSNWEVEDGAELSLVNDTRLRMLDATRKVANRVENFPLRLAQIFLRCVALGHIEFVIAKVLLLLADAELQRLDLSGALVNPKDTAIPAVASDEWAKNLTDKERLFVGGYLQTLNKKQAAEYAGYTHESARKHAYDVFNRPHVREAIELLLQTRTRHESLNC
jgi:hypothetical protein